MIKYARGFFVTDDAIVIIGCGAAGGSAAQFARKTNRKTPVIIFEKGSYPQYSKCGLPYAVEGIIQTPKHLIEFSEDWFKKAKIDLHLQTTITEIDQKNKSITVNKNDGTSFEQKYQSLIIATGASPAFPPIKNIKDEHNKPFKGIFTVRTIDDAQAIIDYLPHTSKATVVGAGLIGLEMADCLVHKKKKVTVIEALPHILPMLDDDISENIERIIKDDLTLFTNHFALEIKTEKNTIREVIIEDRSTKKTQSVPTDILIIATGTKPEVTLAENIGCKIGPTGGIVVNNKSETSVKDIFAVGDCTEYLDFVTKQPVPVGLGSIAVRQGIAAGTNAAGGTYLLPDGVLQTFTSAFFGMQIAAVGPMSVHLNEMDKVSGRLQGLSLPEYYPGGKPILMKTMVDVNTGRLLSSQAVGENAAQRINTYAVAILSEMDVDTFRKLETAYAPPVAPTLDVVTLVADIASMKRSRKKK